MDIAAADLTDVAGARIKWKLMAGGKKETTVIFESMLCAIAVMDIEIDDRDCRQTMNDARMKVEKIRLPEDGGAASCEPFDG